MIKQIKKRPRADKLENEKRKTSSNIGRNVYLLLLALFGISMTNYLWGDFFILRSDGLVLRDESVVAATFIARVADVKVKAGQSVKKGDVLMKIESTEVLERLADLSIRFAELSQRGAELQLRSEVVAKLLPLASRRESETVNVLDRLKLISSDGLLTTTRMEQALNANFTAREERVKLEAENKTLKEQITSLENARNGVKKAINNLKNHYASGLIRAAQDGAISSKVPSHGNVYRAGEPMLSILMGKNYVLAYLPRRYLFPLRAGMKVIVSSGRQTDEGVITDILPVSEALPREFQNHFKPTDRSQLAKIMLTNINSFPTFDKVEISLNYF